MGTELTVAGKEMLRRVDKAMRERERELSKSLPRGIAYERFHQAAMLCLSKSPNLLKCSFSSLFVALREALQNGLSIGGLRQHAYVVPYGNTAQLIVSYKGLIELVRRTGELESVDAETVHEGDLFEYELGDSQHLRHVPTTDPDRQSKTVTHVYAIFRLTNGRLIRNIWTAAQVQHHKEQYSPGWQKADSPWQTNWRSMAIKTVIRDMIQRGRLPLSEEQMAIVNREEPGVVAGTVTDSKMLEDEYAALTDLLGEEPVQPKQIEAKQPEPEWHFAGVGDAEFLKLLEGCNSLGAVSALEEDANTDCDAEDIAEDAPDRAWIRDMAKKRRQEIGEARSQEVAK